MLRAAEVSQQLCRKLKRLGLKTDSSAEGDVDLVCKAITCGLFMNATQFDHTQYDPTRANDAGSNVYRLLRHVQPRKYQYQTGSMCWHRGYMECTCMQC
jgi:hypothetical protein